MSLASSEGKINYIEIPVSDIAAAKDFFARLLDWRFTDYGPDYCSIDNAGIDGGFYRVERSQFRAGQGPLVVLYTQDLEAFEQRVKAEGGAILQEIFEFPGGRRFHFSDNNDNEYAVWSNH